MTAQTQNSQSSQKSSQKSSKRRNQSWDQKLEKTLGGLKFAVILLSIFAFFMVIGTFCESYYGTDFANRVVYKTWFFMLLQFGMFISIIFAAFLRLPPKKRLYGFYTIHAGLIIIGAGSFMTYYAGVDGSIVLPPNSPSRDVILSDDVIKMRFETDGRVVTYKLPYTAFGKNIGESYDGIKLTRYLPFADKVFHWKEARDKYDASEPIHSTQYFLKNAFTTQDVTLSLHPEAIDFDSNATLGPLTLHYLPSTLAKCFGRNNPSKLILWDKQEGACFTPEEREISIQTTQQGSRFLVYKKGDIYYSFFPDMSPWPLDEKMKVMRGGSIRIFSKKLFEDSPNLFLFGSATSWYDKDEELWNFHDYSKDGKTVVLPWMALEVTMMDHKEFEVPTMIPTEVLPIQKKNQMIKGQTRALEIEVQGNNYWVTNETPVQLLINGRKVVFYLEKESLTLPFEFVLTKFNMEKDPGTNRPASYESFVRLFTSEGTQNHHIFMNNPMKYMGFTFYQASYQQDRQGNYISTLSVNVDPGRPFKYAGSLMLVFGSIWHYFLNYRKRKKKNITPLIRGVADNDSNQENVNA